MLQEGLVYLLANAAPVTAILGTPSTRTDRGLGIFQGMLPKETRPPAIVYAVIHAEGEMTHDGPDPYTTTRMQFSCHGESYEDSVTLSEAVRQTLEAFQGTLSDGCEVDSMHRIGELNVFEDAPFYFITHLDFEIAYRDIGSET